MGNHKGVIAQEPFFISCPRRIVVDVEYAILIVILSVFLGDLPYRLAGTTGGKDVILDIFRDDASRRDDDIVPDRDPGVYDDICANPNVIPNSDRNPVLIAGVSGFGMNRVPRRYDRNVWPEEHIIPDRHLSAIEDRAIDVRVEIDANRDILPEVAMKRLIDANPIARLAEYLPYKLVEPPSPIRLAVIVFIEKLLRLR
jgi:hypothetical protein